MSWDRKRRGGKRGYFYRSVRVNGRSVKQYIGTGAAAELIADLEAEKHETRRIACETWLRESTVLEANELTAREVKALTALLVHATMLVRGYYFHHGEWRRRRRENHS
jgi:hypothetical protein